ncbi:MAG: hypothetical protein ACRD1B_01910 [Thermoanaerobaculia bacterium]
MFAPRWLARFRFTRSFGIYTLANDASAGWLAALLESLRRQAPALEVGVIAFDDNLTKVRQLATKYRFRILQDETLRTLDAIGQQLSNGDEHLAHYFRKLAVFWGPFASFLYLDSDIVVTGPLDRLIEASTASAAEFLYQDADHDWVYKPGALRDKMLASYDFRGFNSGCFFSWRGMLTLRDVTDLAKEAFPVRNDFMPSEQPFLNYCVDVRRLKVQAFWEALPEVATKSWAKLAYEEYEGALRLVEPGFNGFGKPVPWLHWAGFQLGETMPNRDLWLRYGGAGDLDQAGGPPPR